MRAMCVIPGNPAQVVSVPCQVAVKSVAGRAFFGFITGTLFLAVGTGIAFALPPIAIVLVPVLVIAWLFSPLVGIARLSHYCQIECPFCVSQIHVYVRDQGQRCGACRHAIVISGIEDQASTTTVRPATTTATKKIEHKSARSRSSSTRSSTAGRNRGRGQQIQVAQRGEDAKAHQAQQDVWEEFAKKIGFENAREMRVNLLVILEVLIFLILATS